MSRVGRPHNHPSDVYCLRTCPTDLGADLLAVGGDLFLEILRQTVSEEPAYALLSSIHLGARVTAIAWSPRSRSPLFVEDWFVELAVACADEKLRLIQIVPDQDPSVTVFGNLVSGHRGSVNDICFCTAGQEQGKYIASVGDDGMCILWDLYPPSPDDADTIEDEQMTPNDGTSPKPSSSTREPPPPFAYPIPFAHPLNTVCSHPHNARSLLVADSRGTLSVINWMDFDQDTTFDDDECGSPSHSQSPTPPTPNSKGEVPHIWRGHLVAEFIDPTYLGRSSQGVANLVWGGGASWKPGDANVFGATYGGKWHVWDQRNMQGGKPLESGEGFIEGGHRFRWCPTNPRLFAVSSSSPQAGATIKVFDTKFPKSPKLLPFAPKPNRLRDFDWIGTTEHESLDSPAWMAVAVGRRVHFIAAGNTQ